MQLIPLGTGKVSYFGGPADTGVGASEGLSCIQLCDLNEWWFRRIFQFPGLWDNSKGLARNLNPSALYCAMRFAYGSFNGEQGTILQGFTEDQVRRGLFAISANGKTILAQAADWGPNPDDEDTKARIADVSPGVCKALGVQTDDIVTVCFLSPEGA